MLGLSCAGQDAFSLSNISNIFILCGIIRGAPQRLDNGSSLLWSAGSRWSSPLYSCASAVKASVKSVTFRLNGTEGLSSVTVDSITDKKYPSNEDTPLWGMEDTGKTVDQIDPVWGILSPDYENFPNVSSVRKPEFYLPGYSGGGAGVVTYPNEGQPLWANIPASNFFQYALGGTYGGSFSGEESPGVQDPYGRGVDYSGYSNVALFSRWQELSKTAHGVASMVNLLWTDLAAPAVVGTRGTLGSMNQGLKDEITIIPIRPIVKAITYDWRYGAPILVLVGALLLITIIDILWSIMGYASLAVMRDRLHQVSPGRIYTVFLRPEEARMDMTSKIWAKTMANYEVDPESLGRGSAEKEKLLEGSAEEIGHATP